MTHVEAASLRMRYSETVALDGVSFEVSGGAVGLVGVNGAGKTTLLRILSTGLAATAGCCMVDGHRSDSAGGIREIRRRVSLMPQSLVPPRNMSVFDFMSYMAWIRGVPRTARRKAIDRALDSVGLGDVARKSVTDLSGGMFRRAMYAQAIVSEPSVLLLDEPTTGLDPEQRVVLRELIAQEALNRVVILSSHVMEDVAAVADRVLMLDSGHLVFDGSVESLAEHGRKIIGAESTINPLEAAFMQIRTRGWQL